MSFDILHTICDLNDKKKTDKLIISKDRYPTVHPDDIFPVALIEPDLKEGPWIAGGAVLSWFLGNSVKKGDIDVFCKSKQQADYLIECLVKRSLIEYMGNAAIIFKSDNATTISVSAKLNSIYQDWKIQIITCHYFDNIQSVINKFDLTVCQIATTGTEWILGDHTAKDISEKNLRFNYIQRDSIKRLTKYWVYGYKPVLGTIESLSSCRDLRWDFENDEDYSNAF